MGGLAPSFLGKREFINWSAYCCRVWICPVLRCRKRPWSLVYSVTGLGDLTFFVRLSTPSSIWYRGQRFVSTANRAISIPRWAGKRQPVEQGVWAWIYASPFRSLTTWAAFFNFRL